MFDFKLTERGDIILLESPESEGKIRIDFMLSKSKPIRLDFYLESYRELQHNGVKLQFEMNGKGNKYHCSTVDGNAAIEQACTIRLKTELGDMLNNENIGSTFETIRHKPLYDSIVQTSLMSIAKEAVHDILPNAEITVTPKIEKNNDCYDQIAQLSIYDEDLIIAQHKVRG